jgi:hypothetical protein
VLFGAGWHTLSAISIGLVLVVALVLILVHRSGAQPGEEPTAPPA